MPIYKIDGDKLNSISEIHFLKERDLQRLTQDNLEIVFGLKFINTEVELNGLRIDTLAFNMETQSFVIIEYKRGSSFSVIDQGYAYLSLVLNNKAEFILEYNESQKDSLARNDVDWSQTRVIFVANSFTIHQKNAINFKDLPIELWEAKKYSNNTILYSQLQSPDSSESINTVSKSKTVQKVSSEVKVFRVDDHFQGIKLEFRPLYEYLKEKIFALDPRFKENPRAPYIGFMLGEQFGTSTVVYVRVLKEKIRITLPKIRPEDVNDHLKKLTYRKGSIESKNTPESELIINSEEDVDYAAFITKQVLERFFK
jgi:predicted transport protein